MKMQHHNGSRAGTGLGAKICLFLLPIFFIARANVVGTLVFGELICFGCALLILAISPEWREDVFFRRFLLLGAVWLGFQIATDIYRGSLFEDFARGWLRIVFFLANAVVIRWLLNGRPERLPWFVAGCLVAGSFAAWRINGFELNAYTWKAGWLSLLWGFLLVAGLLKNVWWASAALVAGAGLSIWLQGRSIAGVYLLTALYLIVSQRNQGTLWAARIKSLRFKLLFIGGFLVGSYCLLLLASAVATRGYLGIQMKEKFELQKQRGKTYLQDVPFSGLLAPLVGGRSEIIVSSRAVKDAPVLGHGSWAKDPTYVEFFVMLEGKSVASYAAEQAEDSVVGLIPTHSHFFGAWVDAGLGGAVFWGFVYWAVINSLFTLSGMRIPCKAIIAFFLINALWDILFSPFDTPRRLLNALLVAILCMVLHYHRQILAGNNGGRPGVRNPVHLAQARVGGGSGT